MAQQGFDFMSLVPLLILTIPLSICGFWLAPKMGANRWLWACLLLVPGVNFVAGYVLLFRAAGAILDRLNALTKSA